MTLSAVTGAQRVAASPWLPCVLRKQQPAHALSGDAQVPGQRLAGDHSCGKPWVKNTLGDAFATPSQHGCSSLCMPLLCLQLPFVLALN